MPELKTITGENFNDEVTLDVELQSHTERSDNPHNISHNSLVIIQGGESDQYYHLTLAEYNAIQSIENINDDSSDTEIIFNNAGVLDGSPNLTFDNTTSTMILTGNFTVNNIYSGDNGSVGEFATPFNNIYTNYLYITPSASIPAHQEGLIFYDQNDKALSFYNDITDSSVQIGQEVYVRVVNKTGSTLTNGTVVYSNDSQGNRITVTKADASSEDTADSTLAILTHDIANNAEGFATIIGLIRSIDVSGFTDSTFNEGDIIYLATTAGEFTNVSPVTPNHGIELGIVTKAVGSSVDIFCRIQHGCDMNEIHDVLLTSLQDGELMGYDSTNGYWKNIPNYHYDALTVGSEPTGIAEKTDLDITVTYGTGEFTVDVDPTGSSFDLYISGEKFTKSTTQSVTVNPAVTDGYFIYFDNTGTLVASTTLWDLSDTVPVCYIYYNATLNSGVAFDERHGLSMDWANHRYLHLTRGTQLQSGCVLSGYTLNTDTNDANSWGLSSGVISDEDLDTTISVKADPSVFTLGTDNYMIFYRSGISGEWIWMSSEVPVPYTTGQLAEFNEYTGATWQLTELTNNYYGKYFVFIIPALDVENEVIIIPAQSEFATLGAAEDYGLRSMNLAPDFPFQEVVEIYEVVFQVKSSYTCLGKFETVEVTRIITSSRSISAATSPTTHNALGGLQGGIATEYYHMSSSEHTEVTSFFGSTDISGTEAETLTDGSNADLLHHHDASNISFDAGTLTSLAATNIEEAILELESRLSAL